MKHLLSAFFMFCCCNIHAQIITTIAGKGTKGYSGDGRAATKAELGSVRAVAVDGKGIVYILDAGNHRIRKVSSSGIITTIAGTGTVSYGPAKELGKVPATTADLNNISSIAVDGKGNVYIGDTYNCVVRKIDASGIISTFAGRFGWLGDSGDGGSATEASLGGALGGIGGVAIDAMGNVVFADAGAGKIRKVDAAGKITTIAGGGEPGVVGDGGQATAASLNQPMGVAIDAKGNIYVTETLNDRVRKISADGIITTIAGNGVLGFSGDGHAATAAQLTMPYGVAADKEGNVFITDNNRVRKIDAQGIISTFAGVDTAGFSGDKGNATAAGLDLANGVTVDAAGNVYIADYTRVRKVAASKMNKGKK